MGAISRSPGTPSSERSNPIAAGHAAADATLPHSAVRSAWRWAVRDAGVPAGGHRAWAGGVRFEDRPPFVLGLPHGLTGCLASATERRDSAPSSNKSHHKLIKRPTVTHTFIVAGLQGSQAHRLCTLLKGLVRSSYATGSSSHGLD